MQWLLWIEGCVLACLRDVVCEEEEEDKAVVMLGHHR